jgi:hypothetical protein
MTTEQYNNWQALQRVVYGGNAQNPEPAAQAPDPVTQNAALQAAQAEEAAKQARIFAIMQKPAGALTLEDRALLRRAIAECRW